MHVPYRFTLPLHCLEQNVKILLKLMKWSDCEACSLRAVFHCCAFPRVCTHGLVYMLLTHPYEITD